MVSHTTVILVINQQFFECEDSNLLHTFCTHPSSSLYALSALTPTFLFRIIFLYVGATLMVWCYRTLGRYFTFEVTILGGYRLATTGTYVYARHTSYTGGV